MSGPDPPQGEFAEIARLFRPLTRGAPGALGLQDDAAVAPSRPGFDLVITKDAVVEGVHVPKGEAPGLIAEKLVRVNVSDLAAKAAEPCGCLLAVAWPAAYGADARGAFAEGLGAALEAFALPLLGGDTVATPGPAWASLTALGWVPEGGMIRRDGASAGDAIWVSGTIGDGLLGLRAALGELADPRGRLLERYRRPTPRLDLRPVLRGAATAAADVSDGLVADARHIAEASGLGLRLALETLPLSTDAANWLSRQADRTAALLALASGGDDYEIVCTAPPGIAMPGFTRIGRMTAGPEMEVVFEGRPIEAGPGGWRHV